MKVRDILWSCGNTFVRIFYGHAVIFSLFFTDFPGLNLTKLNSHLDDFNFKNKFPGITSPTGYVGAPGTFFGDHVEEDLLCSLNYLHNVSTIKNFTQNDTINY